MEIEILKRIIEGQQKELTDTFKTEKIISRECLPSVQKFLKYPNIFAILGIRRSGKSIFSWMLAQQVKEKTAYINFDDERLIGLKTNDLEIVLQAFYELYGEINLIILDEIQDITGWELFVNRLRRTKKIILTGSNSKMLSGELSTKLTGRYIDFTLHPFSFREILNYRPNLYLTEDIAKIRNQLNKYINGSSFPEFNKWGSQIVTRIYSDILNKDCIHKHKIRNEKTFRELAQYLISNFSNEFTYSKLSKILQIKDIHTVKNYVAYIQEAYLIIILERFSPKLKQQMLAPKKIYAMDHGLCNFIGIKTTKNTGKIFENIVCIELHRKKVLNSDLQIYYWKNHQQHEVDFILKQGLKIKQLIQVCYNLEDPETKNRETRALFEASQELKCKNLLIITENKEGKEKIKGKTIKYIPLWKWLLEN